MDKDTALRLALEALEFDSFYATGKQEAITAIKAALEAKDEPAVWNEGVPAMLPKQKEGETFIVSYEPKLEAKDEPVAWWIPKAEQFCLHQNPSGERPFAKAWEPLYAAPQPAKKPLTEQQIKEALADMSALQMPLNKLIPAIARAIEAAHSIKE